MIEYKKQPDETIKVSGKNIGVFNDLGKNIDMKTVQSFGEEWSAFSSFSDKEIKNAGDQYFDIVKDEWIKDKNVLDVGCGTGRWTKYIAPKAGFVEAIDPSKAVFSAANLLQDEDNVRISMASVDSIPFPDNSFDFVFSLGVLHHIPDTGDAMKKCVEKLKNGGHFLVYLYYNFEQRSFLFKLIFSLSNSLRFIVSKLPKSLKQIVCNLLAVVIYLPFVTLSRVLVKLGLNNIAKNIPLYYYRDKSWNIIKNDALDRFGTPLEQRFSRKEIQEMMEKSGLTEIVFSNNEPYWHAVGKKI